MGIHYLGICSGTELQLNRRHTTVLILEDHLFYCVFPTPLGSI